MIHMSSKRSVVETETDPGMLDDESGEAVLRHRQVLNSTREFKPRLRCGSMRRGGEGGGVRVRVRVRKDGRR